jgi:hypothetical protein
LKREGRELPKLKTDLAVTIHSSNLSLVEAESLYKTNAVIKLKVH